MLKENKEVLTTQFGIPFVLSMEINENPPNKDIELVHSYRVDSQQNLAFLVICSEIMALWGL